MIDHSKPGKVSDKDQGKIEKQNLYVYKLFLTIMHTHWCINTLMLIQN